jgi:hypothetical protein
VGFIDSWQVRDAKDVHPSHRVAVVEVRDLLECIYMARDEGNLVGEKGFSAALFLSELVKKLEAVRLRESEG